MNLNIESTTTTPAVIFDEAHQTLEFSGQSYPEDSVPFFKNIQEKAERYLEETHNPLIIAFKLNYFNTSSSKCLLNLLEAIERFHLQYKNVIVKWYYDPADEDMHSSGIDFSMDVLLPFEFIPLED